MSEMCCTWLAENTERKNYAKIAICEVSEVRLYSGNYTNECVDKIIFVYFCLWGCRRPLAVLVQTDDRPPRERVVP